MKQALKGGRYAASSISGLFLLFVSACLMPAEPVVIELDWPAEAPDQPAALPVQVEARSRQHIDVEVGIPTRLQSSVAPLPSPTPLPRPTPLPPPLPPASALSTAVAQSTPTPPPAEATPVPTPTPTPLPPPRNQRYVLNPDVIYLDQAPGQTLLVTQTLRFDFVPGQRLRLYGGEMYIAHLDRTICCIAARDKLMLTINGRLVLDFPYQVFFGVLHVLGDGFDMTSFAWPGENTLYLEVWNFKPGPAWVTPISLQVETPESLLKEGLDDVL